MPRTPWTRPAAHWCRRAAVRCGRATPAFPRRGWSCRAGVPGPPAVRSETEVTEEGTEQAPENARTEAAPTEAPEETRPARETTAKTAGETAASEAPVTPEAPAVTVVTVVTVTSVTPATRPGTAAEGRRDVARGRRPPAARWARRDHPPAGKATPVRARARTANPRPPIPEPADPPPDPPPAAGRMRAPVPWDDPGDCSRNSRESSSCRLSDVSRSRNCRDHGRPMAI